MRKVKKLLGLLLAAVMVLAMGTTAFADEKTRTMVIPMKFIRFLQETILRETIRRKFCPM